MRFSTRLLYYYLFASSEEGNCISIARHPNREHLVKVDASFRFSHYFTFDKL